MNETLETGHNRLTRQVANRESWLKFIECFGAAFLELLAFLGNLLVVWAVRRKPSLRTIPNYYIISLAVSDMLMASIGMPLSLVTVIAGKWVFGDALCQYQGFIGTFLGTVSLLTIMLTAINRYCKITWTASRYASTFTRASTLRRISLVWGLAFLPPIIYLLTGHRYVYHPGKAMCFFDLNNASTLYAVSTITLVVFLPFCTITFCYYKVYKSVRNHNKVAVQDAREETPGPFGISEIKLTKMLFAILLGFLVCWSPFVAIDVINSINGQFSQDRWVYLVYTGCAGLASCVNPLIYSVMNAGFREEFKAMLAFRIRRDNGVNPTRPRSEANKITR